MSGANGHAGANGLPCIDDDLKQWMRCLSGPRLEILLVLSEGSACVGEIVDRLGLDYTNISRALSGLRALRCVIDERQGRQAVYHLSAAVRIERVEEEILVRLVLPRSRSVVLMLPAPDDE